MENRDCFCTELDGTHGGIFGRLNAHTALLRHIDFNLWKRLQSVGIDPQFYALRWLLLLATQEFDMPHILTLWDALLSEKQPAVPLIHYVCVTFMVRLRPALIEGDFTSCMKLLQHLPQFDMERIIADAKKLQAKDAEDGFSLLDEEYIEPQQEDLTDDSIQPPLTEQSHAEGTETPNDRALLSLSGLQLYSSLEVDTFSFNARSRPGCAPHLRLHLPSGNVGRNPKPLARSRSTKTLEISRGPRMEAGTSADSPVEKSVQKRFQTYGNRIQLAIDSDKQTRRDYAKAAYLNVRRWWSRSRRPSSRSSSSSANAT